MANDTVVPFPPSRKVPLTGAERSRRYRARKKAAAQSQVTSHDMSQLGAIPLPAVTLVRTVTPTLTVTPITSRVTLRGLIAYLDCSTALTLAAFASAAVGIAMNGWYARSLGSSDVAGWLFLAIGVVADISALFLPSACTRLAAKRQRGAAIAGWLVWLATFVFAICAGIGFASVNISDVTASRASRITPAVTAAETSLRDAMAARDRECKGGVGKYCREREAAVTKQRELFETAQRSVAQEADPQLENASHIVTWLTRGWIAPTGADFAMLRLMLLALLPQVGGVLLMIGRGAR